VDSLPGSVWRRAQRLTTPEMCSVPGPATRPSAAVTEPIAALVPRNGTAIGQRAAPAITAIIPTGAASFRDGPRSRTLERIECRTASESAGAAVMARGPSPDCVRRAGSLSRARSCPERCRRPGLQSSARPGHDGRRVLGDRDLGPSRSRGAASVTVAAADDGSGTRSPPRARRSGAAASTCRSPRGRGASESRRVRELWPQGRRCASPTCVGASRRLSRLGRGTMRRPRPSRSG
jgi:hypothetical protein